MIKCLHIREILKKTLIYLPTTHLSGQSFFQFVSVQLLCFAFLGQYNQANIKSYNIFNQNLPCQQDLWCLCLKKMWLYRRTTSEYLKPLFPFNELLISHISFSHWHKILWNLDFMMSGKLRTVLLDIASVLQSQTSTFKYQWIICKSCKGAPKEETFCEPDLLVLQMRDIRHENINPFIGFFHDCGIFAIVTEFCSRGSLEDLLYADEINLDWMFISSLMLDLIKVCLL